MRSKTCHLLIQVDVYVTFSKHLHFSSPGIVLRVKANSSC